MLKYLLGRLGLQLNETKTKTVNAWDDSFDFLGFEIRMNRSPRSGKSYAWFDEGGQGDLLSTLPRIEDGLRHANCR